MPLFMCLPPVTAKTYATTTTKIAYTEPGIQPRMVRKIEICIKYPQINEALIRPVQIIQYALKMHVTKTKPARYIIPCLNEDCFRFYADNVEGIPKKGRRNPASGTLPAFKKKKKKKKARVREERWSYAWTGSEHRTDLQVARLQRHVDWC